MAWLSLGSSMYIEYIFLRIYGVSPYRVLNFLDGFGSPVFLLVIQCPDQQLRSLHHGRADTWHTYDMIWSWESNPGPICLSSSRSTTEPRRLPRQPWSCHFLYLLSPTRLAAVLSTSDPGTENVTPKENSMMWFFGPVEW